MRQFTELLDQFYQDFCEHIHSLYLVGSRADMTAQMDSDYDIVCLIQPSMPHSVHKLMLYELYRIGEELKAPIDAFIVPVTYILSSQHFASYDSFMRTSMIDNGICLKGDSVISKLTPFTTEETFNYLLWMSILMFNDFMKNQITDKFIRSFIVTSGAIGREIPPEYWVSKRKLFEGTKRFWPSGQALLSKDPEKEEIIRLTFPLIERGIESWKTLPSIILTKPLFKTENVWFDNLFLLTDEEKKSWDQLPQMGHFSISDPYPRLIAWVERNQLKK